MEITEKELSIMKEELEEIDHAKEATPEEMMDAFKKSKGKYLLLP